MSARSWRRAQGPSDGSRRGPPSCAVELASRAANRRTDASAERRQFCHMTVAPNRTVGRPAAPYKRPDRAWVSSDMAQFSGSARRDAAADAAQLLSRIGYVALALATPSAVDVVVARDVRPFPGRRRAAARRRDARSRRRLRRARAPASPPRPSPGRRWPCSPGRRFRFCGPRSRIRRAAPAQDRADRARDASASWRPRATTCAPPISTCSRSAC